jgi:hypothetical protein
MTRDEGVAMTLPLFPDTPVRTAGQPMPAGPAVDALDWAAMARQLDAEGHALLPGLLTGLPLGPDDVQDLQHRDLATAGLGRGQMAGWGSALAPPLAGLRDALYPHLATVANRWQQMLGLDGRYPPTLQEFVRRQRAAGQARPLSHLSRLGPSDHMALHQQADGTQVFPLQLVGLLSAPGQDFTGGEFVMTERRPRMQSRPIVVALRQGDAALIATAQRPVQGHQGCYRVNLRHAIGRVRSGQRLGLELFFHDAP